MKPLVKTLILAALMLGLTISASAVPTISDCDGTACWQGQGGGGYYCCTFRWDPFANYCEQIYCWTEYGCNPEVDHLCGPEHNS